jgi:chromate transport protein ChrA
MLTWKRKWIGAGISVGVVGVTGVVYILIKKFLSAEYFTPLFDTTWITTYLREGIAEGWTYMWDKLYFKGWDFIGKCMQGIREGLATGSFFVGFILVMVIVGLYALYRLIRKEYKTALLYGHLAFCFFAMWMALLLMYKMQEGSKHLLTFIAAGLFAMAMMEVKWNVHVIVTAVTFVYLYVIMAVDPYDYQIPFRNDALAADMERTTADFREKLDLKLENVPNYDNDVIWVVYDFDAETGEQSMINYQILYGVPEGFGINCCYPDYIIENFDDLQCKYIFTLAGGEIDEICKARNLEVITQGLNGICYRLK